MKFRTTAAPGLWIKAAIEAAIKSFNQENARNPEKIILNKKDLGSFIKLSEGSIKRPTGGKGPVKVKAGKIYFNGVHLYGDQEKKGGSFEAS